METEPETEAEPVAELQIPDTKEGIIERLKEIAQGEEEINRQEVDALKSHFYRILKTEGEAAYKQYVDDGGAPEAYTPIIDPLEQLFKEEMNIVREKRAAQHKALEQQKEQNYLRKLQIIEKIKVILDNPDEVNKSYNEFRALQTEWNSIKDVPAEKNTELWKTYQVNVEKYYDTLKLNNEFRAYDRLPPNYPNACTDSEGNTIRLVVESPYVVDHCNNAYYNILNGNIIVDELHGMVPTFSTDTIVYPLIQYETTFDGVTLRIRNSF